MLGKTHLLFGLFLFLIFFVYFDFNLFSLPFFLFGALLPDIDTPTSILGRKVKLIGKVFSHRGFFHSFLFGLLSFGIIYFGLGKEFGLGFGMGFLSHLIGDMITKEGLYLFPFNYKLKGPFVVGGLGEKIFAISLFLIALLLLA